MTVDSSSFRQKIAECFSVKPVWTIHNATLRIILSPEITLAETLRFRAWLLDRRLMFPDGSLILKSMDEEAILTVHLTESIQ